MRCLHLPLSFYWGCQSGSPDPSSDSVSQWLKTRDADCAVEAFPATDGSKAFKIAQNDCVARMSDERSEFFGVDRSGVSRRWKA